MPKTITVQPDAPIVRDDLLSQSASNEQQKRPRLTQQQLEAHLWGAANILRGKTAGQDYKNYILSLMFYKRLCDQWEHEADEAIAEQEKQQRRQFTEAERAIFKARGEHRFIIPEGARWSDVKVVSTNIGDTLTTAMRAVSAANDELRGVFTVEWSQPAPDASGKPLIANEVVHALIQHFDEVDLSNKSVAPDVLGNAYEYLIKQFADDAGAKAGEFFTPPAVVDALVRMLEPRPGDTIYDPTCGSGGMLVRAGDFLRERGLHAASARYSGQEMNWNNAAICKINSVLHALEAEIKAGTSTITDPQFLDEEGIKKFSLVMANFPFSDEFWWLKPEEQTDDKKKKEKLKKEVFAKEGFKDPYGRFGRGTRFHAPPAAYGDYAFLLHILASLSDTGRAGVVCPQGILFRGQPEIEEETGEFDDDGAPILRRRKADDEYLIRKALIESRVIDAVIALPLNVFYGAGVPACLVLLNKARPKERNDQVLLIYAARHYRELSAQNELRPQDVMRILVHYHAYGDKSKVKGLVTEHTDRIKRQIASREQDEIGIIHAEFQPFEKKLNETDAAIRDYEVQLSSLPGSSKKRPALTSKINKLQTSRLRLTSKLVDRDEQIAESKRRAQDDRDDLLSVGTELEAIYEDDDERIKHFSLVPLTEIHSNEDNLNIPRYVDTFYPDEYIDVDQALRVLSECEGGAEKASTKLKAILQSIGYETD